LSKKSKSHKKKTEKKKSSVHWAKGPGTPISKMALILNWQKIGPVGVVMTRPRKRGFNVTP